MIIEPLITSDNRRLLTYSDINNTLSLRHEWHTPCVYEKLDPNSFIKTTHLSSLIQECVLGLCDIWNVWNEVKCKIVRWYGHTVRTINSHLMSDESVWSLTTHRCHWLVRSMKKSDWMKIYLKNLIAKTKKESLRTLKRERNTYFE